MPKALERLHKISVLERSCTLSSGPCFMDEWIYHDHPSSFWLVLRLARDLHFLTQLFQLLISCLVLEDYL